MKISDVINIVDAMRKLIVKDKIIVDNSLFREIEHAIYKKFDERVEITADKLPIIHEMNVNLEFYDNTITRVRFSCVYQNGTKIWMHRSKMVIVTDGNFEEIFIDNRKVDVLNKYDDMEEDELLLLRTMIEMS